MQKITLSTNLQSINTEPSQKFQDDVGKLSHIINMLSKSYMHIIRHISQEDVSLVHKFFNIDYR